MEVLRNDAVSRRAAGDLRFRLGALALEVGGRVRGNADRWISGVASLEDGRPDSISFLTHSSYLDDAKKTAAGALIVARDDPRLPPDLLVTENPMLAVTRVLELFHPVEPAPPSVDPTAVIDPLATVDDRASVGPFCIVGAGTTVAVGARIHPHVTIGRDCRIGSDVVLHPQVVLYDRVTIGDRSIVHSGTVLGADGFGYVHDGRALVKVPQVGTVEIGPDVEIGANSAVDRATVSRTAIGEGTKIDNLVQIGHNVTVGRNCVLCGQAGVAGSARLGDHVVMAGQSGVAGHLRLGDGVRVAGQAAVFKSVATGATVGGTPARSLAEWKRAAVLIGKLPSLLERLRRLEREVSDLGGRDRGEARTGSVRS